VTTRTSKALTEAAGLLRGPQRIFPLVRKLALDKLRTGFAQHHLYSYANTIRPTANALPSIVGWILDAQDPDGGVAAYYSLLTGYSESYPEVTGYIVPTLYEYARETGDQSTRDAAERATRWLLSLQLQSGAFRGGLHATAAEPSVFNTGQILHGLVRAHAETGAADIRHCATTAGDWLVQSQQPNGSWSGPGAYQGVAHTYYSMVSWALVQLADESGNSRYAAAADRNIDWVLAQVKPSGWIDGINLQGHPPYLHFIAYAIQGVLECGILRRREDAIQAAAKAAWVLLRRFETHKFLLGTYEPDFKGGLRFSCLTGNAQMSCVWLRLFEVTADLRYLNAALKMNEMLKQLLAGRGRRGVVGGVAGSYPIWEAYQPMRYISWGCKFLADALLLEQRLTRQLEAKFEASGCG
jgi:Prenyltransferase and squalene oxidase repeat